jgi:hypothetical protein
VQGNDQRVFLVLGHFGRNEQSIGHLLVGIRKRIRSLLDTGINSTALTTTAAGLRASSGCRLCLWGRLWRRLLREVNLTHRELETDGQSGCESTP